MTIKFLQLNIFKGTYLDEIINFVKKGDFDILQFQEVAGGPLSFNKIDCFQQLKTALNYQGELTACWRLKSDPTSYFGNATLIKQSFKITKKEVVWFKAYREVESAKKRRIKDDPRCALAVKIQINQQFLWFVNTHLAWGPTPEDKPYKLIQGQKLGQFIKNLSEPFILSGDFNVPPSSAIIACLNKIGRNLVVEQGIINTLNPRIHRVKELFPQGLAVDFVFTHPSLKVSNFKVTTANLSDHYGLSLQIEV